MHAEAYAWLSQVVRGRILPALPAPIRVLEFGALDVNGSCRPLFPDAEYVGVDRLPGRGVDLVADAVTYDGQGGYDVVVSTETLEHMPEPFALLESAHRALRPGGMLLVTAAAPPRRPHRCDGGEGDLRGEHYRNIEPADLMLELSDHGFRTLEFAHDREHGDVYALAEKRC